MMEWKEKLEEKVKEVTEEKKEALGIEVDGEVVPIDREPIVGEHIYAEAYPEEKKFRMEANPKATGEEIEKNVCHEMIHIKNPELDHFSDEFRDKVGACIAE